jgi:mono/diheme cytochrome c family protein
MKKLMLLGAALVVMAGCQGRPSEKPPIHVNPNMDLQPKYKAQSESQFFVNRATMRTPPAGTVAVGELREDVVYQTGRDERGELIRRSPVPTTLDLLKRGQERFTIYCAPCHGQTGKGNGIVAQRGFLPPPTFHSDLIRGYPDGQIYEAIANGIRNMPSYRSQIPVADRWAVVAYVRALQRSQFATADDVPSEIRKDLK